MAGCDYRSCDVCGGKTFYDANLSYEYGTDHYAKNREPYRVGGEPQYPDPEMNQKYGMRLGYVGDWAVLCEDCAKTHKTMIVPIEAPNDVIQGPRSGPAGMEG